ncbi:MAG TPA: hypothetical protein PKA77_10535 [Chitinophagaceae bacterium]|nr:hypothetical protein [Chitinophagaceae bacterium]HMU58618.1 hypothetical protein [Chitinophagaceae bacterium]
MAEAPVEPQKINSRIASALLANDFNTFFSILEKDKSLVNSSVIEVELSGNYGLTYKKRQSLLHYLVRRVINKTIEVSIVQRFLSFNPDLAVEFDKKNVFYYLLDYVASHPIVEVGEVEEMLKAISNQPAFNINKPYSNFLPPLPYLLRTNHEFLNGKYSENYISEDIIMYFIEKGANVNTYDQVENNLTTFSIQGHSKKLMQYLQNKGGNFDNKNLSGKDAFYFAVQSNNTGVVKNIVENGYKLTLAKANELKISEVLNKTNSDLLTYLTQALFKEIKTYEDIVGFIHLFTESKNKILESNVYISVGIPDNKTPQFVSFYETGSDKLSAENQKKILTLKTRYLNNVSGIKDLITRLQHYPLFNLKSFTLDYYSSEETTNLLLNEIDQVKDLLLHPTTKNFLKNNINEARSVAKTFASNFDFWITANPRQYLKFTKATFSVPPGSDFIHLLTELKKYLLSLKREHLSIIGIDAEKNVEEIYGIGIKENKGIVCFRWYREGKMGDDDFLAVNTGFSALSDKIKNYLQQWGCSVIKTDYLGSMAYDEERIRRREESKIEQCENCVIDVNKSEVPRIVEKSSLIFGTYTDKEYGMITMKNGSTYKWDKKGDTYIYVQEGLLGSRQEFSSFEKMYASLIKSCRTYYCNQ